MRSDVTCGLKTRSGVACGPKTRSAVACGPKAQPSVSPSGAEAPRMRPAARFVRGLAPMRNPAETYLAEGLSNLGIGRAASLCAHT